MYSKRILVKYLVVFLLLVCTIIALFYSNSNYKLKNKSKYDDIYKNITVKDIPEARDYYPLTYENKVALQEALDTLPIEDLEKYLYDKISSLCKTKDIAELSNLTISKDELSLFNGENKKSLFNANIEIELSLLSDEITDNPKIYSDNAIELINYLSSNDTYTVSQVKNIKIKTISKSGHIVNETNYDGNIARNMAFKDQPKLEYDVQTLAYSFKTKNSSFILQKFGILNDKNELYLEYKVDDKYFFEGEGGKDTKIANLQKTHAEILDFIMSKDITNKYLQENNIQTITISFYNNYIFNDDKIDKSSFVFSSNI